MSKTDILNKVNELERGLQELKVGLLLRMPRIRRKIGFYNEQDILLEAKRTRGQIWKERYAKKA